MSSFTDWIERRRGLLSGCALGIALSVLFLGQSYREVQRFSVDPNSPPTTACLGLSPDECVERVVESGNTPPERAELEATRRITEANRIGARQRARARQRATSTGGTPSSSSSSTTPRAPSGSSQPPTQTPPASNAPAPPSGRPSPPATSSPPARQPTSPSPTQPPPTTAAPAAPPPTTSTPPPTTPTVPRPPRPPVNIPVPPIPPIIPTPPSICTPVGGINCPPGSVQAKRISNRGPGNDQDPVRPGSDPDSYDIDPTTPSDNVNPVPNRGNNGEN